MKHRMCADINDDVGGGFLAASAASVLCFYILNPYYYLCLYYYCTDETAESLSTYAILCIFIYIILSALSFPVSNVCCFHSHR